MDERIDGWVDGQMDEKVAVHMDGWMGGRMNRWMVGWRDGWWRDSYGYSLIHEYTDLDEKHV